MKNLVKRTTVPHRQVTGLPQLFEGIFNNDMSLFLGNDHNTSLPAVNISESEENFLLEISAPGFAKEDFGISVEGNTLTLTAKSASEEEPKKKKYNRREFRKVAFKREFNLPENASSKKIDAVYNNGILNVTIAKLTKEEKGFRNIPIS